MSLVDDQVLDLNKDNALDVLSQRVNSAFNVIGAISAADRFDREVQEALKGEKTAPEGKTVIDPEIKKREEQADAEELAHQIGRDMSGGR